MKKFYLFLLISLFIITGCTKNYNSIKNYDSVDDYAKAMKEVRLKNNNYTIRGILDAKAYILNFSMYKKNNKCKTKFINNKVTLTYLYDGESLYLYNEKYIVKNFNNESLDLTRLLNIIFDWSVWEDLKFNGNKNINNYDCRLLSFKSQEKRAYFNACISDKYGIAVNAHYLHYLNNTANAKKTYAYDINVNHIDNNNIPDKEFSIPKNLKEVSSEYFWEYTKKQSQ